MFAFIWVMVVLMLVTAFTGTKNAFDGEMPVLNSIFALTYLGFAVWGLVLVL